MGVGEGKGIDPGDGGEEFADSRANGLRWVGAQGSDGMANPRQENDGQD